MVEYQVICSVILLLIVFVLFCTLSYHEVSSISQMPSDGFKLRLDY